jgi:hypothetical protein
MNYVIIKLVALKCIMQVKIKSHAGGYDPLVEVAGPWQNSSLKSAGIGV